MRDYQRENRNYKSKPKQIHLRVLRNAARRKMVKRYGKARLRGKDIDHRFGVAKGNAFSNLRIQSRHDNRSFRRKSDGSVLRR